MARRDRARPPPTPGSPGPPAVDSIRVVSSLSWRYRNPAWLLAERLGQSPPRARRTRRPAATRPQSLVNTTALEILAGELDVAVLAGGEAWRTRMRARKAGADLDWPKAPERRSRRSMIGDELDMTHPAEAERGDRTCRCRCTRCSRRRSAPRPGATPDEHLVAHQRAVVAVQRGRRRQPVRVDPRRARPPRRSARVAPQQPDDRLPVPKYMNSNNDVDMAAALIMCSVERGRGARRRRGPLGVPARRAPTATSTPYVSQPLDVRRARRRSSSAGGGRSSSPASASTTSPSSTCTRASRRPCSSARAVARARPRRASSPAPAGCRSPAGRGTTT